MSNAIDATGGHSLASLHMDELCKSGRGLIVRDVFERIGDKWTLLVVGMLDQGPQRFTTLRKRVPGISQRMLTLTLRHLERDGLVSRKVFAEVPPRVEYTLTELGRTLLPPVIALAGWALDKQPELTQNREAYDLLTEA